MTNSEISALRIGDLVHERVAIVNSICVPYTITADAAPAKSATHFQAYGVSRRGGVVVRVTHNGDFHLASSCPHLKDKKGRPLKPLSRGHTDPSFWDSAETRARKAQAATSAPTKGKKK